MNLSPLTQLQEDRKRAQSRNDPLADLCTLATATVEGQPSARVLVLRGLTESNLELQINRTSPKWQQLEANPRYELLIYYPSLSVQYRLQGSWEVAQGQGAESWLKKHPRARALDELYSQVAQSSPIESHEQLQRWVQGTAATHMPEGVATLLLLPRRVEIWREAQDRVHLRSLYELCDDLWRHTPIMP